MHTDSFYGYKENITLGQKLECRFFNDISSDLKLLKKNALKSDRGK